MSDATFLTQMAVRRRMQCSGQVAAIIEETFVTVEQLVEAVESYDPLTDIDGTGPATAETIESWWDNRFEREREVDNAEVVRTGAKTATIHNLGSKRHNSSALLCMDVGAAHQRMAQSPFNSG